MHLTFAAICEDASARPDGRLDVHGVYHDLAAPGFPARQDRLVLVLVLEWDRGDHGRFRFKADLEDEDGEPSLTVEGETEVRSSAPGRPPARSQLVMPLEDVVFPHAGLYRFRVRAKGRTMEGPSLLLLETTEPALSESFASS
ncbi:MAG TPA: hypothetical protein VFQ22_10965 [Longimicrobiales bacterium]|nr:hypothetical protein [Longimicrobiales bacterium]